MFADIDRLVGPGEYVVALSSDHGTSPIPEQMVKQGFDAGRIRSRPLIARVDAALTPIFGAGTYAAAFNNTQLYFRPGIYERLQREPAAMQAVRKALLDMPGVGAVFRSEDIESGHAGDEGLAGIVRRSHFPGRSGDLIVVPKPYWITSIEAATHGTGYGYDAHVPVVLMGKGIKPGEYLQPATPADIAPTLGFLMGVTLARPDGRVLHEALASTSPQPSVPTMTAPAPRTMGAGRRP